MCDRLAAAESGRWTSPPAIIGVGSHDFLYQDSVNYAAKLREVSVPPTHLPRVSEPEPRLLQLHRDLASECGRRRPVMRRFEKFAQLRAVAVSQISLSEIQSKLLQAHDKGKSAVESKFAPTLPHPF